MKVLAEGHSAAMHAECADVCLGPGRFPRVLSHTRRRDDVVGWVSACPISGVIPPSCRRRVSDATGGTQMRIYECCFSRGVIIHAARVACAPQLPDSLKKLVGSRILFSCLMRAPSSADFFV